MNTETPFLVLSADRIEYDESLNALRRDTFEHQLRARELDFKRVDGSYKGTREVSYVVLIPTTGAEADAIRLARRYGQESVLYVDANRFATLITLYPGQGGPDISGHRGAGWWREVDQLAAQNAEAYTRDGERFYVTKAVP